MEIVNFQVPRPAFYAFVLQAVKSRVGPGIKVNGYVCIYTLSPISPLPQPLLCTHTHSPRWLLCAMKSRTGCSTMLTLNSKRSSSKRETLRNGSNPTWPNWHRHQDSDCLPYQFMSAASVCSISLETSQKSLQEQFLWFLSDFFCWCMLFTKPLNHRTKLHTSKTILWSRLLINWATSQARDHVFQLKII